jgi:preprotein translocase subunit SecG/DNA-directed RNA polymerase subunit RPC12/RpoP
MKFCTNCGQKLSEDSKFCTSCGLKIENTIVKETPKTVKSSNTDNISKSRITEIDKINKKIELKNNQSGIVKGAWYSAAFFILIILLAFIDLDFLPIHPAIVMLSIFFFIMSIVIGFMFRSREKKLQTLISGENLLAEWTLTSEQKKDYSSYLFKQEFGKNKIILFSIATIAIVVFGIFILVIDEGKFAMFLVLIGLIIFLAMFAFGMPFYYKIKNANGDGNILIGAKYAYVNGYFHNWDFPLSGLSKINIITEPFYGLYLVYYYTDRTLKHSEELYIPANKNLDLDKLIKSLNKLN